MILTISISHRLSRSEVIGFPHRDPHTYKGTVRFCQFVNRRHGHACQAEAQPQPVYKVGPSNGFSAWNGLRVRNQVMSYSTIVKL
jgi:hypothetical protein